MELSIIKIGNSRGLRLPKEILDRLGFADKVEAVVNADSLTLYAAKKPRSGWAEAARAMHDAGGDALLIPDALDDDVLEGDPW
jgi:antitoxin MazE